MTNNCSLCNKPASQTCAACNSAYYCTKEHQKKHWKAHKTHCAPYRVLIDDKIGRYLVATRDIRAGETIMTKKPLILAPKMASLPLCLGCHKRLKSPIYKCTKCRWPLCSQSCETSSWHRDECGLFASYNFQPKFNNNWDAKQTIYSCIAPLRVLLLKHNNDNNNSSNKSYHYDDLMKCQSHLTEHLKTPIYHILKQNLVPLFLDQFKLSTTEQEILTICSIFDTNSFEVRNATDSLVNIRGLYPIISLLAHNCRHNTKHTFRGDELQLVLTATMPIRKGDMITTTYTRTLWGTLARRTHLKQFKHFECECERCQDATEFGTYIGSICCTRCHNDSGDVVGDKPPMMMMTSVDSLDRNASWICQRCGYQIPAKQMIWGNEALTKEIAALNKSHPKYLEEFLDKYRSTLHAKNSHNLEIKYALSQMYGNMKGFELDVINTKNW